MYNAEKYIENCLDSILNSDLPKDEYEVIIINDGSKDNSPEIAKKYVEKHESFIYLTQKNQGQSVARNYGIKECKGEYVWFVDCDDKVEKNIFNVYNILNKKKNIDIIAFQLKVVRENSEFVRTECEQPSVKHDSIISGREAIIDGYNPSSVCALFLKTQFVLKNNLFFKEGITHQDVELSYRLFAHAERVLFTEFVPYIYILHPNSTSQSLNPEKKIKYLKDDIVVYKSFMSLSQKFSLDKELSKTIYYRAKNILFCLLLSLHKNRKVWGKMGINKSIIQELKKDNLYPLRGPFDSYKKLVAVLFLNHDFLIR